jgi:hypothetical protein
LNWPVSNPPNTRRPLLNAAVAGVLSVATISISSDHFDKIFQFLAGIEIYPFAGLVGKSQAPVPFALDPNQVIVSFGVLGGIFTMGGRLIAGCHGNGSLPARQYGVNSHSNWPARK